MDPVYEIVVRGELGPMVAAAFEGMQLECREGETSIVGPVTDQAHLSSLLSRVADLGLDLVSVERLNERLELDQPPNGSPPSDR